MAFRPPLPQPTTTHFDQQGKPNPGKAQWLQAIDSMLGGMGLGIGIADGSLEANISGAAGPPTPSTLSAILDHIIGSTRGMILVRGASLWQALALGANGKVLQSNGTDLAYATLATPAFTLSFTSAQQTINSAGALTLAHSLGTMPTLIQVRVVCQTGENGYSVNDELIVNPEIADTDVAANRGLSIVPDATNLNVRYGSDASVFTALNKSTGAQAALTNGNWKAVFRAWA